MGDLEILNFVQKSAGAAALRKPYIRLVHLELSSPSSGGPGGLNPFGLHFTPEEEEEFGEMARSDGFYERFAKSVAPSIFGSLGACFSCSLESQTPTDLACRYQKSNHLSLVWRLKKDIT